MPRRLDEISSEFERGVFLAVYRSRRQRWWRRIAMLVLLLKYLVRGLVIIWPAYLIAIALLLLPGADRYLYYFMMLVPGVVVWLLIYMKGARDDYAMRVDGQILEQGFIKELFLS